MQNGFQKPSSIGNYRTKRLLKFKLTDGLQTVYGFESDAEPLPYRFNRNCKSSRTKLLLFGETEVRRGLLFLSYKNVRKLGSCKVIATEEKKETSLNFIDLT